MSRAACVHALITSAAEHEIAGEHCPGWIPAAALGYDAEATGRRSPSNGLNCERQLVLERDGSRDVERVGSPRSAEELLQHMEECRARHLPVFHLSGIPRFLDWSVV